MAQVQEHKVPSSYRDNILKWNGWGYDDSYFQLNKKGQVTLSGGRYDMSGQVLPLLRPWFEANLGVDMSFKTPAQPRSQMKIPEPIINQEFIDHLRSLDISFSNRSQHRLIRSHGHTMHDMSMLRYGAPHRVPDLVVWPKSEEEVVKVVEAANKFDVVIIPIGGGTSVSNALECPEHEKRSIVSLDMALLDRILWVDGTNLLCRAQAGIVGQSFERQLNAKGFTCGHEPDSIEFSTLGGWVSTRASGMKKNKYGNIEDLVVHVNLVTPKGLIHRQCQVPRISSGPDLHHVILGSEGTLGVVTEVTVKIFPLPEVKKFGSIVFPSFKHGVDFFREVAKQRSQPASLRLVDNEQFIMGQSMKLEQSSYWKNLASYCSKLYITKWKGFEVNQMVAATCVFEGSSPQVDAEEKRLYEIAQQFDGVIAGEENGRYGYRLTFAIAYLRDLGMEYGIMGESFETSVPWDKVINLCRNVKQLIKREAEAAGVKYPVLASCRVTQVYDSGACVYFYFGFNSRGLSNALDVYDRIESAARDEIIACGGSISHHHGIGKLRKKWMPSTVGEVGISVLKSIKNELDPQNIFASGNLIDIDKARL
ncbi:hypothetical protein QR680_012177 [Steinernema hermaphroditum]|uniref:Alkylglycerone-phosphate synthase n=1 Tax=Steinernema hermaphroditum TaxID=289476 RepID=A0AA39M034_9BILA|nr:hypothetical protein QR680_012177 [Steinernema hermaphroditum]